MIPLNFDTSTEEGLEILCLGAHCDDIEIGCGGTLLKLIETYPIKSIRWIVFASNEVRKKEAFSSAAAFLDQVENKEIIVLNYPDSLLQFSSLEIKKYFETLKLSYQPHLIFTHYRDDRHQDHRLLSDLTWNTFRNHFILEYEIPKYDGDLGKPNYFCQLSGEQIQKKIDLLLTHFKSQKNKHWFDAETFQAILRLRGMESASPSRFAEAFYLRKGVF